MFRFEQDKTRTSIRVMFNVQKGKKKKEVFIFSHHFPIGFKRSADRIALDRDRRVVNRISSFSEVLLELRSS